MERKQFTFYKSFLESIEQLPTNKEKLQAYQLICHYGLYGIEPELGKIKPCAATVFHIAAPVLDAGYKRAVQCMQKNSRKERTGAIGEEYAP